MSISMAISKQCFLNLFLPLPLPLPLPLNFDIVIEIELLTEKHDLFR
jgi:hypothetical protein